MQRLKYVLCVALSGQKMSHKVDKTKEESKYFTPIREEEKRDWRSEPRSYSTKLIELFVDSNHQMVEVKLEGLEELKPKKGSRVKSTKQDRFASSFYSWKKRKKEDLKKMLGIEVKLIRRGERIALRKVKVER